MKNNINTHNWVIDCDISYQERKYICTRCGELGYKYSYEIKKELVPDFCIKNGLLSSFWLTCEENIIKSIIE